ncbi:zinc finger and SCAN domain-containing protein 29-like [Trichomycterus rosablanca]|uniref:zinc finger and SCAN domain-containing protein 29-like n=1 Tax=Trichomycterus rosablanca TaxID=2290929 RepID=UPI002F35C904
MSVVWSVEETLALLGVWSDSRIQDQLEGMKRNEKVYQTISELLAGRGIQRSSKQCRDKIKKLKYTYRMHRDKKNRSGRRKDRLYQALDRVLGSCGSVGSVDPDPARLSPVQVELGEDGMEQDQQDVVKSQSPADSLNNSGHSESEASVPSSPVPAASTQKEAPPVPPTLQTPPTPATPDGQAQTSHASSTSRRSVLGRQRHQQTIHTEFLAYLRESDAAHLTLLEAQHRRWMESREADRAAEAVQAAERLRVDETFNNQFISVFGQFVQVLRDARSQTHAEIPPD